MLIMLDRPFGGLVPRSDKAQLPLNSAQIAENVKLHGGTIRGWRAPLPIYPEVAVDEATTTLFYDRGADVWFTWDSDVNIVQGPVADDGGNRRYYYTGNIVPRKTDSSMAIAGAGTYPQTYLNIGVMAPTIAPTIATNGAGAGTPEDHVYVFTYVSEFSDITEEGAPSPPVTLSAWKPGDTVTITWQDTPPTSATGYNVTARRIYRSNGGDYLFVAQQTVGPATYADSMLNDALSEAITTTDYDEPPDGLQGLVSVANGILAGFLNNELLFCEPYQPHAWPVRYRQSVPETIVALVGVGQGLYVLTDGHPYFCSGTHPEAMTLERIPRYSPCMSKRSAVSNGIGAIYASYNGVIMIRNGDATNITQGLFTQEEWRLLDPASLYGVYYDDRYMLWYSSVSVEPFVMDGAIAMDGTETMDGVLGGNAEVGGALVFDSTMQDAPLTYLQTKTKAAHMRPDTGLLYIVDGDVVSRFDADSLNKSMYEWRSRMYVLPKPVSMKAVQVYADHDMTNEQIAAKTEHEESLAQALAQLAENIALWNSGAFNAGWGMCGVNQWEWAGSPLRDASGALDGNPVTDLTLSVRVYADGVLVFSATVANNKPMLLPGGFMSDTWEISVSGNKPVRRIVMGTSMAELKAA